MSRRAPNTILLCIALGTPAIGAAAPPEVERPPRPNILFVLTDDHATPGVGAPPVSRTLPADEPAPHMANGIKIGEVTSTGAIVWVRLTKSPELNRGGLAFLEPELLPGEGGPMVRRETASPADGYCHQIPAGRGLEDMEAAVAGRAGDVRMAYGRADVDAASVTTDWMPVGGERGFTHQFRLKDLVPGTAYRVRLEGRPSGGGEATVSVDGSFRTAPDEERVERIVFTVVTGQMWDTRDSENGPLVYPAMARLDPSFFVHTGDIVYYDKPNPWVTHVDLARFKWNRMYAQPHLRDFHLGVPSYFMKDDHDSWQNDCWPTMSENRMGLFTWEQGRELFLEQVPMGETTYRTIRWGRDLQIWLVEGRDFRTPNDGPDGPANTIWGEDQLTWFETTVAESDATFRILISPTPILGPDHLWKAGTVDNHVASGRSFEGDRLRDFIAGQKNIFIVCGDRHWQYVSKHGATALAEYSSGPTTDRHATTLKNDDRSMLTYLREAGGFLSVTVERVDGAPRIVFRHHDVHGAVRNEDVVKGVT